MICQSFTFSWVWVMLLVKFSSFGRKKMMIPFEKAYVHQVSLHFSMLFHSLLCIAIKDGPCIVSVKTWNSGESR
jgi:hypothetical protein